ncbi:MAG: hypothetical protein ACEPOZ_21195 [Marinifilaceae bacterium]
MKKILIVSIALFLWGIQKGPAQNYMSYYQTINRAEIASLDREYQRSDSLYQVAFELVGKPFKDDCLLAAINSEKLNWNEQTYGYLKKGISVGLRIKSIKKHLSRFKKSGEWKSLKKDYESLREQYLQSLNLALREELMKMVDKDQAIRHPIFGNSKKQRSLANKQYSQLLEIIKENNGKWPGRFTIGDGNEGGKYAVGEVTIMLHHFSTEQVNNLRAVLVEAVRIGDLSPYNVAYPLDYKNSKHIEKIYTNKKKTIGYYNDCFRIGVYRYKNGDPIVICDCEKAEEERKKLGLEPLEDYYRKRNTAYECYEEKVTVGSKQ